MNRKIDSESVHQQMIQIIERHNEMAANVAACEQMLRTLLTTVGSEIGMLKANFELLVRESDRMWAGLDRNVLALAEIIKEIFGQLSRFDFFFQKMSSAARVSLRLDEDESARLQIDASRWYQQVTAQAFETVRTRFAEEEQKRMAQAVAEEAARKAAEQAAVDTDERNRVEAELRSAAASDRSVTVEIGGAGAPIPDGADIFGGN